MNRLTLFLKGIAMGTADVIPGVSGGTLALILGIYRDLVDTIKGLSPRVLLLILAWLQSGRTADHRTAILTELKRMNLEFLIILGAGIATAIVLGSAVIPGLMDAYPVAMRAFFFGLIMASVYVPLRMIGRTSKVMMATIAACAAVGVVIGFALTDPARSYETTSEWTSITTLEGETMKDATRRGPSSWSSDRVFWAEQNGSLRARFSHENPAKFSELEKLHAGQLDAAVGKDALKARAKPYDEIILPADTPLHVPRPAIWFVFIAGIVAICAMILPGISGSYILLIFGLYFFILNALKGFLSALASGSFPIAQGMYVIVFCAGCLIGILSFARLLSYLLHHHAGITLGLLVGLMLGCLRGIWPFRALQGGVEINVLPVAFDQTTIIALVCCVVGSLIVGGFTWMGHVKEQGVSNV